MKIPISDGIGGVLPVEAPESGKRTDLISQLEDLRTKLNDPNLSRLEKQRLYDQLLRIENALSRISPGAYGSARYVAPSIIDQINGNGIQDQDVPIGQPVDFQQAQQQRPAKEKKIDPEKYKDQGGLAPRAKKKGLLDRFRRGKENAADELKDKAKDQLKGKAKEGATKSLSQGARQLAAQLFNKAKTVVVQFASKNPAILIIAAAIVLVGIMILIFWGMAASSGSSSPNANGTTFVQAVDPLKDQPLITKILHLSGDAKVDKKELDQLVTLLTSAKQYASTDTAAKIDALIPKINALSELTPKNGQEIIDSLKNIVNSLNPCAEVAYGGFYQFVFDEDKASADLLGTQGKARRPEVNGARQQIVVDPRVCNILAAIENNKTAIGVSSVQITAIANHHDDSGAGPANHWDGRAVDIDDSTGDLSKIMQWIDSNQDNLTKAGNLPAQVIGPDENYVFWAGKGVGKAAGYKSGTLNGHKNHVHIGFTIPKK